MQNFEKDNFFKGFNLGLGESAQKMDFWENEYSPSSSFLDLADTHKQNFEEAAESNKVTVQVDRLDNIFDSRSLAMPLLIKIDVQGFEDKVIQGGINTLQKAKIVICELSFIELYKGQLLFADLFASFAKLGFVFTESIEQLRSPETNQILQADGIFINQH